MTAVKKLYDFLVLTLAVIAGALLAVMFGSVVYDVTVRESGYQPPLWAVPLSEYLLLYITVLGAPWVLRDKGHVLVDSFVSILAPGPRRWVARCVYLICALTCLVIAWLAAEATVRDFIAGSNDVRAVVVPKFLLSLPFVPGFALMAIEFLRYLAGRDSLYADGTS
jgi:C4-dicarboxylate transporter, DctQ subunit